MTKFRFFISASIATLALLAASSTVFGQNAQTYVANLAAGGVDGGSCFNRATPCLTINGAFAQTNSGGTIFLLTPLVLTSTQVITRSVTIDGSILGSTTQIDSPLSNNGGASINAFTVTLSAISDNVVMKNLSLNGFVLGGSPTISDGVRFTKSGALTVEKCFLYNFGNFGINFSLDVTSLGGKLFVRDSRLTGNYNGGIQVESFSPTPTGAAGNGGLAEASIDSVRMENSFTGVGFQAGRRARATIRDSVASSNAYAGIAASPLVHAGAALLFGPPTPDTDSEINVVNTVVAYNYIGVSAGGAPGVSKVRLYDVQVISNFAIGVRVEGGCELQSLGGNIIWNNGNNGDFNVLAVPRK